MDKKKSEIAIVGAGIAGLVSGRKLLEAGHAVYILESRSRTGGRIESIRIGNELVECGPEFIHGKLKETITLLNEFGIEYVPVDGKIYSMYQGKLSEENEMVPDWDLLLQTMKQLKKDQPFSQFLSVHFPDSRNEALRTSAIHYAEGFDLANPETASTLALLREWSQEDGDQFRIPSGYGSLIDALEQDFIKKGGRIVFNQPVQAVSISGSRLKISTGSGTEYSGDRVLITVPVGLLQQDITESIDLSGIINDPKKLFRKTGYGSVIKMVMIWQTCFWKEIIPEGLFVFSEQFFPTWWTRYPMELPILTGWLGGPAADLYPDVSDDFFLEKALQDLSVLFSVSMETLKAQLKEYRVFNWRNEAWSRGAYSYALAGDEFPSAIKSIPAAGKLYFSGEAYYRGPYPGTVEAAVVHALETADRILAETGDV